MRVIIQGEITATESLFKETQHQQESTQRKTCITKTISMYVLRCSKSHTYYHLKLVWYCTITHQVQSIFKGHISNLELTQCITYHKEVISFRVSKETVDGWHDLGRLIADKLTDSMLCISLSFCKVIQYSCSPVFLVHPLF